MVNEQKKGLSANCSVRVLCTAVDSSPCLVLSSDNQSYAYILAFTLRDTQHDTSFTLCLITAFSFFFEDIFDTSQKILFDAGEGIQRLCLEHKVRLSKTDTVCFTRLSPHTVAGSPGLALTCADSGCEKLRLMGPLGLESFWVSTADFTHRKHHEVIVTEITRPRVFDTGEVIVEAFPISNVTASDCMFDDCPSTHICYICKTKSLPGRFDTQKAKSLGVPVGPLFAKLKSGQDVTLPDGRIVRSKDVIGASESPRYVIIICDVGACPCPLENETLKALLSNSYLDRFTVNGENYRQVECIFHLSCKTVTNSPAYKQWISRFNYYSDKDMGKNISADQTLDTSGNGGAMPVNVFIGVDNSGLQSAFLASTLYTRKLHAMFPTIFTPLSIIQRRESTITDEDIHSVESSLRIIDDGNDFQPTLDADEEDINVFDLGPPPLVRVPNTTLAKTIALEEQEEKLRHAGGSDCNAVPSCHGVSGLPGMMYTLLPKSARGLTTNLSDAEASSLIQREVDNLWTDPLRSSSHQTFLQYLQDSEASRRNVRALKSSRFVFSSQSESSQPDDNEDDYDDKNESCEASTASPLPYKRARISDNVNDSSDIVRQDCLLLASADCAISFLGTGCAIPSKYRNVSGIFLQLSDTSGMLLDCGEGTWQQLLRMAKEHPGFCRVGDRPGDHPFSSAVACQWLARTIRVVWISHPHADHHLGLMTLVSERRRHWHACSQVEEDDFIPLLVIAPPSVLHFLDKFSLTDKQSRMSYVGVSNSEFEPSWFRRRSSKDPHSSESNDFPQSCDSLSGLSHASLLSDIGIKIENVAVHHCSQSFGVRVDASQGWSLVYSGDTRPCPQLLRMGQGATILIHEATFDDTKPDEAIKKRHSTISEAVQVAKDMGAHRLILTHFSQRYPALPPLPQNYTTLRSGMLLAFDFMSVPFPELLWTHTMNPALLVAFPPDNNVDDSANDCCIENSEDVATINDSCKKRGAGQQTENSKRVKSA